MLVAPLYARHKGVSRKTDEDGWSIPWILRFCYLIRALKYIFPLCIALIGVIDFLATWRYCALLPLFSAPVFTFEIKACFLIFFFYAVLYFIILVCDCASIIASPQDPKIKCLIFCMLCSILFCISPFFLYAVFAVMFSFQTWTIESSEYSYVKWIYLNIIQYLQNDINTMSIKYFRIARDRPLRIYIIMFKALIMWLNIQLFQFLLTDYPRYCHEWQDMRHKMELVETRKRYAANINHDNDDMDPDDHGEEDKMIEEYYNSNSSLSPTHSSNNSVGCCDFNFNKNEIEYSSLRVDRYTHWCNERHFKSLRSPLAIIHEIVNSYPATQIDSIQFNSIDYVNVYNLSQRHLYRYSNETYDKAQSKKHPIYAYAAIALYLCACLHTIFFFMCYHFGFKDNSQSVLGYIYLLEYIALYGIFTMMIFNVLHCDRLLTIIQNTSWFDDKLIHVIYGSLVGGGGNDDENGELVMKCLADFYVHHKRVVQITVQHYMMLHVLNILLPQKWLSELIIEYLYGFHAFGDGDDNIKNIIHGTNHHNHNGIHEVEIEEWSLSESIKSENEKNNLDNLPIPTDDNFLGISNRIINTPNIDIDDENVINNLSNDLLNQFMEEKYDENGLCVCHEDDKGFIRMWDELNLDVVRLQYNALKKSKISDTDYDKEITQQHNKTTKSMEFYFDFIRSLHYEAQAEQEQNINDDEML